MKFLKFFSSLAALNALYQKLLEARHVLLRHFSSARQAETGKLRGRADSVTLLPSIRVVVLGSRLRCSLFCHFKTSINCDIETDSGVNSPSMQRNLMSGCRKLSTMEPPHQKDPVPCGAIVF